MSHQCQWSFTDTTSAFLNQSPYFITLSWMLSHVWSFVKRASSHSFARSRPQDLWAFTPLARLLLLSVLSELLRCFEWLWVCCYAVSGGSWVDVLLCDCWRVLSDCEQSMWAVWFWMEQVNITPLISRDALATDASGCSHLASWLVHLPLTQEIRGSRPA